MKVSWKTLLKIKISSIQNAYDLIHFSNAQKGGGGGI